jgi:hypothetical protein
VSELWFVVSVGHCGTQWLAEVLDSRSGIRAYHELKNHTCGLPWHELIRYEQRYGAESARYREYWKRLRGDLKKYSLVVDSNSWQPTEVPTKGEYRPDRIIYLVRHGVSQIHSLWNGSGVWSRVDLEHYALDDYLRKYWEISGESHRAWDEWDRWERVCLLWSSNALMPERLREQDFTVDLYRFEDLTQARALQDLIPEMTSVEMQRWKRRDINRKINGSRRPHDIWEQWTPEQREVFNRICSDGMAKYGYEIPG